MERAFGTEWESQQEKKEGTKCIRSSARSPSSRVSKGKGLSGEDAETRTWRASGKCKTQKDKDRAKSSFAVCKRNALCKR